MFKFEKKQIVYEIANIKIGGDVGQNPTVMIGSIFYKGDKNIKNEKTGDFDKLRAESLINNLEDISNRTSLPAMLDIVCTNPIATEKYLTFAADVTNMPLLIDSVSEEAAIKGMEYAKEIGIIERTILNSINPDTKESIYQKIKETGLETAIVLTYSTKAIISSKERVKLLDDLLPKVKKFGVKNILIDTVVMDITTLGLACKAIFKVKDKFGYPSGCGAHNAVSSWKALKKKKDKTLTLVCSALVNGFPIAIGADFVLYGPIDEANYMFPALGIIDAAYGQVLMETGKRPIPNHPRFKISQF
jgi:tetrahydromethanopterin S-methyltransferase subunit H